MGELQARILEEEGVDPNRVYIGHSNDDHDMDYLLGLLDKGCPVGVGPLPGGRVPGTPNWEQRTEIAKELIDGGLLSTGSSMSTSNRLFHVNELTHPQPPLTLP